MPPYLVDFVIFIVDFYHFDDIFLHLADFTILMVHSASLTLYLVQYRPCLSDFVGILTEAFLNLCRIIGVGINVSGPSDRVNEAGNQLRWTSEGSLSPLQADTNTRMFVYRPACLRAVRRQHL